MVIQSWTPPKSPEGQISFSEKAKLKALSRPADRLAAVVIDLFIVLLPVYLLLSAPFKLNIITNLMMGSDVGALVYGFASWLVAVVILLVYQTFMHTRYGATIGKMIFHLEVRSLWQESRPDYLTSFKRAVIWNLEVLALGIPFLSIFTDNQRRVLHDRICDTEVISLKHTGILPPQSFERRMVYSFLGLFTFFLLSSIISSSIASLKDAAQERSVAALLSKEGRSCEGVNKALEKLNSEEEQKQPSRLQIAMTLYAAGAVEKSCLADESEQLMDINFDSSPLTYLAKAFVHSDEPEISDAYLDQVCKEDIGSPECSMSELVSRWSEEDWAGVEKAISESKPGSGYMEIWAIRHFLKQGQFAKAMEFIDKISPNIVVSSFLQTQRVKALWGLDRTSDAEIATVQALDSLPASEQKGLASFTCFEQIAQDCAHVSQKSCGFVKSKIDSEHLDLSDVTVGLAELKIQECTDPAAIAYESLADKIDDVGWKIFLSASDKLNKNDNESASALFSQVVKFAENSDELRLEAMRRFLKGASTNDILDIVSSWRDMNSGELWRRSGQLLLSSLISREEKVGALKVARSLFNQNALSKGNLVQLAAFVNMPPSSEGIRAPASVEVGNKVRELLESVPEDEP